MFLTKKNKGRGRGKSHRTDYDNGGLGQKGSLTDYAGPQGTRGRPGVSYWGSVVLLRDWRGEFQDAQHML